MRLVRLFFALVLVLAACGDDDTGTPLIGGDGGGTAATADATDSSGPVSEDGMLEELRSRCEAGDYQMCDILYQASDFGSALEAFADSCGDRVEPSGVTCSEQFDVTIDLDGWQTSCGTGDMVACDLLYIFSDFDSIEEAFADSCGGIGEGSNRTCTVSYGFTYTGG